MGKARLDTLQRFSFLGHFWTIEMRIPEKGMTESS
jgi:hypothetical protein